ncbi:peptidylprolyl isomerase [Paracoccaceae bacterium]|nr:peptidylprolyl isomerase [Paracoccaceae bacterium]
MALKKKNVPKKSTKKSIVLETNKGNITIELLSKLAPMHCKRILKLSREKYFDEVVFHRVIEGFMAQTGDGQYGSLKNGLQVDRAGMGGSELPDLEAEFTSEPFSRGIVGMARSQNPNSANSQFFIMLEDSPHLNNQYTVWGKVVKGMDVVDKIKKGDQLDNGKVDDPDFIKTTKNV